MLLALKIGKGVQSQISISVKDDKNVYESELISVQSSSERNR